MVVLNEWFLYGFGELGPDAYVSVHGIVTGHQRLEDGKSILSSSVRQVELSSDGSEVLVQTLNTLYHCPVETCRYDMGVTEDYLPEFAELKKRYYKEDIVEVKPNTVLLVLSEASEFYFKKAFKGDSETVIKGRSHIGMMQDSFLICSGDVSLKYFPHPKHLEFYEERLPDGYQLEVYNAGITRLWLTTSVGVIELKRGERKIVCSENATKESPILSGADLYPPIIVELEEDEEDLDDNENSEWEDFYDEEDCE